MTSTSHDVARLAGVSQPTVSRALRGDPRVAATTRAAVERAATQLGYVPSDVGRSLSTRSTRQIAMVADLRNALYPALVEPLHDRFAEHGLRMVLLAERGDRQATYDRLLDRSVDGVVLTTTSVGSSLSAGLRERALPFVELNRVSGQDGADTVEADNLGGAAAVTKVLVGHGHTRIAAIFGPHTASTGRDRAAGVRSAMLDSGLELPDSRCSTGGFGFDDGIRGFDAVMRGRHRPTAIVCLGDLVAIGALNEARRRGLRVPEDVAIVGFDDIGMAGWPSFDLTTVRIDLTGMAIAAADQLVARLRGAQDPAQHRVFDAEVVLRGTHA